MKQLIVVLLIFFYIGITIKELKANDVKYPADILTISSIKKRADAYWKRIDGSMDYLPLSGGTLTGALYGTSVTFSGAGQFGGQTIVSQGAPATSLVVRGDWDATATNNTQIYITGFTNINKQLRFGYETTSNYGHIQALVSGTTTSSLSINPSGGNVGIGTVSPAKALDVYNSATTNSAQIVASDASSINRLYYGTLSNNGYISFGGTYQNGWTSNGSNAIANIGFAAFSGASIIKFETSTTNAAAPTERGRITPEGRWLFGTTSDNGSGILQANGNIDIKSGYQLYLYSSDNGSYWQQYHSNGLFGIAYNGTTKFNIASTGAATFSNSVTTNGDIYPGANSNYNNGTPYNRWATIFSDHGSFSGDVSVGGNVGIGTTAPTEKLSVNGNIRAKKLIVSQTGWPDYVFDASYTLRPLSQVEKFITTNKRLPEMPSAKEVEENGISVGDNQALLLKKIEELTLYVIDLQKQINELKKNTPNK